MTLATIRDATEWLDAHLDDLPTPSTRGRFAGRVKVR